MRINKGINSFLVIILILGLISGCSKSEQMEKQEEKKVDNKIVVNKDTRAAGEATVNGALRVLEGKIICIDPGHQAKGNSDKEPIAPGSDIQKDKTTSGTAGIVTKIPEYKLNLEVSMILWNKLEQLGAKVIMTRVSDDVDISNVERAKLANDNNADIAIRIHADWAANSKVRGASVLYPGSKYISDNGILKQSKEAAVKVKKQIEKISDTVSVKTVERNDMTGFNWSKVPVILVEMGFMSNPEEDRLMKTKEFRESMAEAIAAGVVEYFE